MGGGVYPLGLVVGWCDKLRGLEIVCHEHHWRSKTDVKAHVQSLNFRSFSMKEV